MGIVNIVDILVKIVGTLTTWPAVVLLSFFFFRREVGGLLTDVGRRITRAPGGFEFSPVSIQAFRDILEISVEHFKDDPVQFLNFLREELGKLMGARTTAQNSFKPLSGRSILWIDNKDPGNLEYAEQLFRHLGVRLVTVRSTEEALQQMQKESVDGVVHN